MRYTELGKRMKSYEEINTSRRLIPNLPVYVRIDGRAFHTFTKELDKPICKQFFDTMVEVCMYLVDELNADLGYVQSDEISLAWLSNPPFEGKLFKMESIIASMTTSKFCTYINEKYYSNLCKYQELDSDKDPYCIRYRYKMECDAWYPLYDRVRKLNPSFDCRVVQLPNTTELANMFIWRELDAVRNSVQSLALTYFKPEEITGLTNKQLQNLLFEKEGINWNELASEFKRGVYIRPETEVKEISEEKLRSIPEDKRPDSKVYIRKVVKPHEFPPMNKVKNKKGVYFDYDEPIMRKDND